MTKPAKKNSYVYVVSCKDGTLYTGWTVDLNKRLAAHNSGKASKYTRSRRPVTLEYYETFEKREDAMSREYSLKKLSRKEKLKLFLNKDQ